MQVFHFICLAFIQKNPHLFLHESLKKQAQETSVSISMCVGCGMQVRLRLMPPVKSQMSVLNCVQCQSKVSVLLSELPRLECWQSGLQMTRACWLLWLTGRCRCALCIRKFVFMDNISWKSLPNSCLKSLRLCHGPVRLGQLGCLNALLEKYS